MKAFSRYEKGTNRADWFHAFSGSRNRQPLPQFWKLLISYQRFAVVSKFFIFQKGYLVTRFDRLSLTFHGLGELVVMVSLPNQ